MNIGLDVGYSAVKAIAGTRRVTFPSVVGTPDRARFSLDGADAVRRPGEGLAPLAPAITADTSDRAVVGVEAGNRRIVDAERLANAIAIGVTVPVNTWHAAKDVAVSVTGVAGPDGGTAQKPVGLVHMALARRDTTGTHAELRLGNIGRDKIRRETVSRALRMLLNEVSEPD